VIVKVKEGRQAHDDSNASDESDDDASEKSPNSANSANSDGGLDLGALVDAHPVATLLGALGVGYVVGGGVFTSLTRRLLGTGLRLGFQLAVLPALEREVAGMAGDLGKTLGNLGKTEDGPPRQ
jgi:hypothetical protein